MYEELILNFIARTYRDAAHSVFSPSGSHMWMTCPGALVPNLLAFDQAGYEAAEGTVAHSLHEEWLLTGEAPTHMIGKTDTVDGHEIEITRDMLAYVEESVDRLINLPGVAHVEQKVYFSQYTPIPKQGGTADFFACHPGKLVIRDYKHGKGVQVWAEENSQAMLYALGVFLKWDWLFNFQEIDIGIHQPRLDHFDYWTTDRTSLLRFAQTVRRTAKAAWRLNAPLSPSEKACRFCKVKASCPAFLKMADDMSADVFRDVIQVKPTDVVQPLEDLRAGLFEPDLTFPDMLGTADMAKLIPFRGVFEKWFSSMEEELERRALDGQVVPGRKLVEARTNRVFSGEAEAVAMMEKAGIPWPMLYSTSFVSPAQAEDLLRLRGMRKGEAVEYLAGVVRKPSGKPVLVDESDKRPPYTSPDEGVFDSI